MPPAAAKFTADREAAAKKAAAAPKKAAADAAAIRLQNKGPAKPVDPDQLLLLNELLDAAVTKEDWPEVEKITNQLWGQAGSPEAPAGVPPKPGLVFESPTKPQGAAETQPPLPQEPVDPNNPASPEYQQFVDKTLADQAELENFLNPKPPVATAPPAVPQGLPEDLPIVPPRTVSPGVVQPGLRPVEEPAAAPRRKYQPPEADLGQMLGGDKGAHPPPPSPPPAPAVGPAAPVPPPAAAPTSAPVWPERTPAEEAARQDEIQTDMMRRLKEWKTRQEGDRRSSFPPATPYPPELERRLEMGRRATDQQGRDAALGRPEPPIFKPEPAQPADSVITPPPVRPGVAPDPNPTLVENPRTGVTAPDPNAVVITDPSVIGLDPQTTQQKESDRGTGVPGARAVARRGPPNPPPITLHERLDGSLWVADGHQRFNKYLELKAAGHQLPPLRATIFRGAEGFDVPTGARAEAIQNVTEGSTSALDIAKLLRDGDLSPDERAQIPKGSMSGALLRAGEGLRGLTPEAWQTVLNRVADPEAVATVGKYFTDPQEQIAAIAAVGKRGIKGYIGK